MGQARMRYAAGPSRGVIRQFAIDITYAPCAATMGAAYI